MKATKLGFLYVLFFLLAASTVAFIAFEKPIRTATRATNTSVSGTKSVVLADMLAVPQKQKATISVFARNEQGLPLADKTVTVVATQGTLVPTSGVSDANGLVKFTLEGTPGERSTVKATVDQTDVSNSVIIYFQK